MATEPQVVIGGIHDIYISSNLKSFLVNRIECEINFFPFLAPFSLLVSRFAVSPCRLGVKRDGAIAFVIKQPIVLAIMCSIV